MDAVLVTLLQVAPSFFRHFNTRTAYECLKMNVNEYTAEAHKTDWLPSGELKHDINPRLGLAGEIGLLLTALKKEVRENRPTAASTRSTIKDELGDILWYAATVAKRGGLDFQNDVLLSNLIRIQSQDLETRDEPAPLERSVLLAGGELDSTIRRGVEAVDSFGVYQKLAFSTSRLKDKNALVPYLARIWSNAGELLTPFGNSGSLEKREVNGFTLLSRSLGDIMWYVAGFASVYGLDLDEVASENIGKIHSAFPSKDQMTPTRLYDEGHSELERFPRRFCVNFVEADSRTAVMLINGVRVGDPLTDNAYTTGRDNRKLIDGYRFHDSIHLAFTAVLGWSPVIRKLMMRKRKSTPEVDEVEDGARARIVEEMIAKIAHSHAVGIHEDRLFDDSSRVNLNLLKDIVRLAEGLEVAGGRRGFQGCKYWEWEKAILKGFRIYNMLRRCRGGTVTLDLEARCITFNEFPKGMGAKMNAEET